MKSLLTRLKRSVIRRRAALLHTDDPILQRIVHKLAAKGEQQRVVLRPNDRLMHKYDAIIRREAGVYVVEHSSLANVADQLRAVGHQAAGYIYWLVHCPPEIENYSVTIADGDHSGWAKFSPSTNQPHQVAITDPYFFDAEGFEQTADWVDRNDIQWSDRSSTLVWRGADTGLGTFDPIVGAAAPDLAPHRLMLWIAAQDVPDADIALSTYGRDQMRPEVLRHYGLLRDPINERTWISRKYAIDIDGHTNSWSNLLMRMHLGCCVLKVKSRHGYRQWYYDRLKAWEHYVPVQSDLSDFAEKVDWVRSHDADAAAIASNGRRFARSMSFESGIRDAVELICRHASEDNPFSAPDWRPRPTPQTPR